MERLITLREYVLNEKETPTLDMEQFGWTMSEISKLNKIRNYATFLSQPLQLGFFVPCDLDGNILEEPGMSKLFGQSDVITEEEKAYNEAKSRVLFEGFKIFEHPKNLHYKTTRFIAHPELEHLFVAANFMVKSGWSVFGTVEKLVKYNLELTPTAKKIIIGE